MTSQPLDPPYKGLELTPKDPKALFRRAQAYEALDQQEKAYADARALQAVDPKNSEVQHMLTRLHKRVQDIVSLCLFRTEVFCLHVYALQKCKVFLFFPQKIQVFNFFL